MGGHNSSIEVAAGKRSRPHLPLVTFALQLTKPPACQSYGRHTYGVRHGNQLVLGHDSRIAQSTSRPCMHVATSPTHGTHATMADPQRAKLFNPYLATALLLVVDFSLLLALHRVLLPHFESLSYNGVAYRDWHPQAITWLWSLAVPCFLFWVVSFVFAGGHAGIFDIHWAFSPVLFTLFYSSLPGARYDATRTALILAVGMLYGLRLNFNYMRTIGLSFITKTDWRYEIIRDDTRKMGLPWPITSFLLVFVAQYLMVWLGTLPIYAAQFDDRPVSWIDFAAFATSAGAILFEGTADNQLQAYISRRSTNSKSVPSVLDSGLWYYSRHPNYFGESMFWIGLFLFGVSVGAPWTVVGPLNFLGLFFGYSIAAVEKKMEDAARDRKDTAKLQLLAKYKRTTSSFIPWFKFADTKSS